MLRAILLTIGLCGGLAFAAKAADGDKPAPKRPALTEEQKTLRKE